MTAKSLATVRAFSDHKALPVAELESRGLSDDPRGIRIRYVDADESEARGRYRPYLGSHPTHWDETELPIVAYGLWFTPKFVERKIDELWIVEGESDALTLWHHGIAAFGIPGSTMTQVLRLQDVAWATSVYVVQEPDASGAKFAAAVAERLRSFDWRGNVRVVRFTKPLKDPSELHVRHSAHEAFVAELDSLKAAAHAPSTVVLPHGLSANGASPRPAIPNVGEFTTVGDLLAEHDVSVPFLVEGLITSASSNLLGSKPKAGKTTLATNLALCVARGEPFLDRETKQGTVLYIALEGNRREWRRILREMGAMSEDPLYLFIGQAPTEAIRWLRENTERHKPVLIVIDTFQRLTRLKDINDYAAVTLASEPLIEIAQTFGAALLWLHHNKKKDEGDEGDAILGSTALFGAVDTLITLKRHPEGRRTISTRQRFGDDLAETVVVMDTASKRLSIAGARADIDRENCEAKILTLLEARDDDDAWLERADILDEIEARNAVKSAAFTKLWNDRRIGRIGGGKRKDPHRYAALGKPEPTSVEEPEKDPSKVSSSGIPVYMRELEKQKLENGTKLTNDGLYSSSDPNANSDIPRELETGEKSGTAGSSGIGGTRNAERMFVGPVDDTGETLL